MTPKTQSKSASPVPIRAVAEVLENRQEGGGQVRLVLAVPGWPGASPGQFLMLSVPAVSLASETDPLLPRPMAVYRGHESGQGAAPGRVEVLYRIAGRGTQLLSEIRPGQDLALLGPLGVGFGPIAESGTPILVGGGTGIASIYELAARGAERNSKLEVVLGARSESDLMALEDFEALGVHLSLTTEDGSRGTRGRVTDVLKGLLEKSGEDAVVYACGPTAMMDACAKLALRVGALCRVSLENSMACGFGVCLGCAVPVVSGGYSLVCRDGPVFEAGDVDWEGLP